MKNNSSKYLTHSVTRSVLSLLLCTSSFAAGVTDEQASPHERQPARTIKKHEISGSQSMLRDMPPRPASPSTQHANAITLTQLTEHMDKEEKDVIEAALNKLNSTQLTPNFTNVVNQLSQGMNVHDKSTIITILGNVDPSRLTEDFLTGIRRAFTDCDGQEKILIIKILSTVPADQIKTTALDLNRSLRGIKNKQPALEELLSSKMAEQAARSQLQKKIKKPAQAQVPAPQQTQMELARAEILNKLNYGSKQEVIEEALAEYPNDFLMSFVDNANTLTNFMKHEVTRRKIIQKLAKRPSILTTDFIKIVDSLTHGEMRCEMNQSSIIDTLINISNENLNDFSKTANKLIRYNESKSNNNKESDESETQTTIMKCIDIAPVIKILANIPAGRREPFCITADILTTNMNGCNKRKIIEALCKIPAEHLTPDFARMIDTLTAGMKGDDKASVVDTYTIYPERLTPDFVATVNKYVIGLDLPNKSKVICALINIPPARLTDNFEASVTRLTAGINAVKSDIICELGKMSPERLTLQFEEIVNRLATGLRLPKVTLIQHAQNSSGEHFSAINANLTEAIMQTIQQFVPLGLLPQLLRDLQNMPTSAERIREINRMIDLYRHDGPVNIQNNNIQNNNIQNNINIFSTDIHNYSRTIVIDKSTKKQLKINDAIIKKLEKEFNKLNIVPYTTALDALSTYVNNAYKQKIETIDTREYTDNSQKIADKQKALKAREWQHEAIKAGKDDSAAQKALSLVYTLLHTQQNKLTLWMDTYLEESLNARGNDTRSCVAGMRERVITSLRSVISSSDITAGIYLELNDLFNQVEGTVLASKFMLTINMLEAKNHNNISSILMQKGITNQNTPEEAATVFGDYVREALNSYGLADDHVTIFVEAAQDQLEERFEFIKDLLPSNTSSSSLNEMDVNWSEFGELANEDLEYFTTDVQEDRQALKDKQDAEYQKSLRMDMQKESNEPAPSSSVSSSALAATTAAHSESAKRPREEEAHLNKDAMRLQRVKVLGHHNFN